MFKSFYNNSALRIGSLVATAFILFFSATDTQAQCVPDCPGSAWGGPQTRNITLFHECPGCVIIVTYETRLACGIWQDLQITQIELVSGCGVCTSQEVFEAAFEALIMDTPPLFPDPAAGQCANTWRISSASCFNEWLVTFPGGGTGTFLVPCEGDACCLTPLRVCRDQAGDVTSITVLGGPFGGADCNVADPVFGEGPCFTACEFDGFSFGKGTTPGGRVTHDPADAINHSIVMPNPVNGSTVEFELNVNASGQANLVIYDLQGRLVAETEVELNNGPTRVALDISKLQAGTYVYELTAAGRKLVSDKLVIGN